MTCIHMTLYDIVIVILYVYNQFDMCGPPTLDHLLRMVSRRGCISTRRLEPCVCGNVMSGRVRCCKQGLVVQLVEV